MANVEGEWWAAGVCQWSVCGMDMGAEAGPSQRAGGVERSGAADGDGDDGGGGGDAESRAAGVPARVQVEPAERRGSHVDSRCVAGRRGGRHWRQTAGGAPSPAAGRSVPTGKANCIPLQACAVGLVTSQVLPIQNLGFQMA